MTDKKTFGSFIKEKRTEKNYSQKDLAEMLFVTEGAVSKWERGVSYPDITLISDICRVLDISEHELLSASTDTDTRKIKHEARKFRTIRATWFWIPTISYAVALLVCFICNLAVNGTLSWFFVVLTALLCAYSFVPTFTSFFKEKKLLGFVSTSFVSICILLFTCSAYRKTLFWFPTACIGVLMGYILLFAPLLLSKTRIKQYSFIIVSVLEFTLVLLLFLAINAFSPFMLTSAIKMTCFGFAPVFLCGFIYILRFDSFLKAGICTLFCTVAYYFTGHIVNRLFNLSENYYQVNFNNWEQYTSGNVLFIILLSALFMSVTLIGVGAFRIKKR
ncbi:MAG: helix-turn-helix transcriptional regulator [Oscillospiraceae bacterium]|nr:helix-turn-helix transcriptional regulator [Oscillospiraceae bacterium]